MEGDDWTPTPTFGLGGWSWRLESRTLPASLCVGLVTPQSDAGSLHPRPLGAGTPSKKLPVSIEALGVANSRLVQEEKGKILVPLTTRNSSIRALLRILHYVELFSFLYSGSCYSCVPRPVLKPKHSWLISTVEAVLSLLALTFLLVITSVWRDSSTCGRTVSVMGRISVVHL